ncbi:class I SAM-dependent methyltransferase [Mycobacterium crocinum]|uniref:Class I SAM-dependent methyltransferase n=1 Tax=Mycolicibacterium crocinum TaxID=388459 RepID=A0ABY3TPZ4_9MYCO|nr:class I SAM-dependent methyltransferase [Mycolicibacterium crocinum]MCV7215083.1 class I SAM-dependent methyltransferase [Mycolicibacterium crocinum]ULN42143.1 class I SAM-dependent methyltransferase [Mycolicibacterium crocinum]
MVMAPFDKITNTYTGAHAWMYETVVAPAVYESRHAVDEYFLPDLPQNGYVLDVGCGGGLFTKYLADKRPDLRIVGIDLSQPQLDRVSKRMAGYSGRVSFQLGDATNLDFGDETFDGVLSYGSIKHWTDQARGMGECIRVLKRGGPLLVTEADRSATFEDAERFITFYKAPRFLDRVNLAIFRTWIAGRAIDLDDGRALADRPDLVDVTVTRIPGSPIMMIAGRRAP